MERARRGVVVALAGIGLLGAPAPAPVAAAEPLPVAVFADDPVQGVRTFDAARGATVAAALTSERNDFTVAATDGGVTHQLSTTATSPLGPGTFQTGPALSLATDSCGSLTGTLTITELTKDAAGDLATLAASYDGTCQNRRFLGTVRYHSAAAWWGVHAPPVTFPNTTTGQTSTRDVTVTATGTTPVRLGTAATAAPFAVAADGCAGATLDPGASCTVTVRFAPPWTGQLTGTLTVASDGPRGSVQVGLKGLGANPVPVPSALRAVAGYDGIGLSWSPPCCTEPAAYRVYRDGGSEPVATVTAPGYAEPAAPGETHSYAVTAVAADGRESTRTAATSAAVPAAVTETTGPVTGYALEGPAGGHASTAVTLGTPQPAVLTLRSGDRWVTLRPLSGSAWTPGKMTSAVVGAAGCNATAAELTVHEAKVRADGTPVTLAVSGTYPCGGGTAYLDVRYAAQTPLVAGDTTPDQVQAPVTKPGTSTPVTTVTVANGGSVPLDLGTAAAPAAWPVSDDTCSGTTVPPGGSCTFGVAFAPATAAVHDGTLTIPDNTPRGHRAVRLTGTSRDAPTVVRNLVATPLAGRVLLTYDPPENAYPVVSWYVVSRATSPSGPFTTVGDHVGGVRFSDPYPAAGKRLYYQVRARNHDGLGPAATAEALTVGSELVYVADTGNGTYHLTARGLPGGAPARLTTTTKDEEDPSFTVAGALAFTREDVPGRHHVYLAGGDGTGAQRAAGDVNGVPWTYRNPRLSPDGSRLAFACRPTAQQWWDLCVRSQSSGTIRKVPAVLPSGGSWLSNNAELVVVSATSPPTIQVVAYDNSYRIAIPGTAHARQVALAPDGSRIAWVRYEGEEGVPDLGGPRYTLRVSPLSGGAGVAVTTTGYSNDPSWSLDSGTVYFTHLTRAPGSPATRDVYSVPASGAPLTRLTDTPDVDEDHVAFRHAVSRLPSPQAARPMADFTGDGKAEIAVFRPGTGAWRIRGLPTVYWGRLGDIPVAADYTGDRKADRAVFRPSTGTWHVYGRAAVKYGRPGDVPVPADYNGDGKTDLAVFRPSTGQWFVYGRAPVVYGVHGVIPVPADYTGDRRADIAFFHPEWGAWHVRSRPGESWQEVGLPVPADYFGLGYAQPAVLNGKYWQVDIGTTIATVPRTHHDVPAYGNFNGDRRAEPAVFNPTLGLWRVLGQSNVTWGRPGDIPV